MTKDKFIIPLLVSASLAAFCFPVAGANAQAFGGPSSSGAVNSLANETGAQGPEDGVSRLSGANAQSSTAADYPTMPPPRVPPERFQSRVLIIEGSGTCPFVLPESATVKLDCVKIN